ncbi:MAG TPA: sugar phosphate isomerase/epimerase [Candidatus Acidoferrales bacterium]
MIGRREFLASTIAAVGSVGSLNFAQMHRRPLGVQLYTVRAQAAADLPGVLAAIRQIGYEEVETYWNVYSRPAAELKRIIQDHGLRVPSGHFDYDGLEAKIDYAKALGVEYMICPMLPKAMWMSLDGFKQAADQYNRWGEQVKRSGMRFGFHNHNYEFRRFGNTTGFDALISRADANLVCMEMDCYWIVQAGQDPVEMFKRLGSRIQLLHLKDRKAGFPASQDLNEQAKHFAPVGDGTLDWKAILQTAEVNGVRHVFVEKDSGEPPPIEALRISYQNLERLL